MREKKKNKTTDSVIQAHDQGLIIGSHTLGLLSQLPHPNLVSKKPNKENYLRLADSV